MSTQKNTKTLLAILLGTLSLFITPALFSSQVQAKEKQNYIGLEIPYSFINYGKITLATTTAGDTPLDFAEIFESNPLGIGAYFGSRSEDSGYEFGFATALSTKKDSLITSANATTRNFTSDSSIRTLSLDVLFFSPLNKSKNFELIYSLGIVLSSLSSAFKDITPSRSSSEIKFEQSEIKPRLGIGVQYKTINNLGIRAVARWQDSSFFNTHDYNSALTRGLYNISIGVIYDL